MFVTCFRDTFNISILHVLKYAGFVSVFICKRNSVLVLLSSFSSMSSHFDLQIYNKHFSLHLIVTVTRKKRKRIRKD
jgi:hypothetical protein